LKNIGAAATDSVESLLSRSYVMLSRMNALMLAAASIERAAIIAILLVDAKQ
jgi:hypothetical protein